jgi:hypothetical protein
MTMPLIMKKESEMLKIIREHSSLTLESRIMKASIKWTPFRLVTAR